MDGWMERRGRGRPPSDFRAGIPKSALDFVTSPRIRYKQNELRYYRKEAGEHVEELQILAQRRLNVPVAPTVKWIPSVVYSHSAVTFTLSLLLLLSVHV